MLASGSNIALEHEAASFPLHAASISSCYSRKPPLRIQIRQIHRGLRSSRRVGISLSSTVAARVQGRKRSPAITAIIEGGFGCLNRQSLAKARLPRWPEIIWNTVLENHFVECEPTELKASLFMQSVGDGR